MSDVDGIGGLAELKCGKVRRGIRRRDFGGGTDGLRLARGGIGPPDADVEIADFEDVGVRGVEDEGPDVGSSRIGLDAARVFPGPAHPDAALDKRDPVQARIQAVVVASLVNPSPKQGAEFSRVEIVLGLVDGGHQLPRTSSRVRAEMRPLGWTSLFAPPFASSSFSFHWSAMRRTTVSSLVSGHADSNANLAMIASRRL